MKKRLMVLLCVCILVTALAAGSTGCSNDSIIGKWQRHFTEYIDGDVWDFKEDGTIDVISKTGLGYHITESRFGYALEGNKLMVYWFDDNGELIKDSHTDYYKEGKTIYDSPEKSRVWLTKKWWA